MKFVGIVGSNADQSYNRMLLQFIQRHFKVKFELELLEIKDVPMFNQDEDQSDLVTILDTHLFSQSYLFCPLI